MAFCNHPFFLFLSVLNILRFSEALAGCPSFPQPQTMEGTGQKSSCGEENKIFVEDSFPVTDAGQCEAVCKATAFCKFFTLNSQSSSNGPFNCGLRSYTSALITVPPFQKLGTKSSGLLNCDQKVLVGKKVLIRGGGSLDCQRSCQTDTKCKSWTWNKSGGLNPETCVHNYGITARKLFVGPNSNIVSGPKYCEGDRCSESTWPGVARNGKVCGDCKVMAKGFNNRDKQYSTCEEYCGTIGLTCNGAWEDKDNSCKVLSTHDCSFNFRKTFGTSDAICQCDPEDRCDESNWPEVKEHGKVCGDCKVMAKGFNSNNYRYSTCEEYCANVGLSCIGAWEDKDNSCTVLKTHDCHFNFRTVYGTSDAICHCA